MTTLDGSNSNVVSDYNNFYDAGDSNFLEADLGGGSYNYYRPFTSIYSYIGAENRSLSVNPQYISDSNFVAQNYALKSRANPILAIKNDIFGAIRSVNKPSIGASEIPYLIDAGIDAINNHDSLVCSGLQSITVDLKNYGFDTLKTDTIHYLIDSSKHTYIWSGNLAHSANTTVTIGTYNFPSGTTTIPAWSSLSKDSNRSNDSSKLLRQRLNLLLHSPFQMYAMVVMPVFQMQAPDPPAAFGGWCNAAIYSGAGTFIGASSTSGHIYSWTSKPGGFSSTSSNPFVSPIVNTIYYLTESISATGCSKSDSVIITVNPLPSASFTKSVSGTSVKFSPTDSNLASYSWSFGDGGTDSSVKPTHSYSGTDTYTVHLIVKAVQVAPAQILQMLSLSQSMPD